MRLKNGMKYSECILELTKSSSKSLFASKNHVPSVAKQLCLIFMTYSCPSVVLGCLKKKKKKEEREDGENRDLADICVHI